MTPRNYADSMPNVTRRILKGFDRQALIAARAAATMTQGDLARIAGVSLTAIRDWEKGNNTPQVDKLAIVARTLDVPLSTLVVIAEIDRTLADLRILAGLTQPELGKAAGISTTAVGALERAEVGLSDVRAAALAEALAVDVATVRHAYSNAKNRPLGAPA